MKRLLGGNKPLCNIHGEEAMNPRTGLPHTYAQVLGDLADRQFAKLEDVEVSWDAAAVMLRAFANGDEALLENAEYEALVALVVRAYMPDAMVRHGYHQGGLRQLGTWLASAEDAKVAAVSETED
ncbi:MAG TPA: hypothetical protein VM537_33610 [Anaerolineae bacterium]|nr:hypothetical protein [Anaerolineae bacterium]